MLQVSDGYPPAVGGLERTVKALADELAHRGHESRVATLETPATTEAGVPAVSQEGSVTVHRLRGWTRHLQRFSVDPHHQFHPTAPDPQLVRRLQELVDEYRPDVVHAHGWILNSCLSLRLPPETSLVVTLHDHGLVCAKKTLIRTDQLDTPCGGPSLRRCLPCASDFYGPVKGVALTLGLRESRRRLDRIALYLPLSESMAQANLPGVSGDRYAVTPPFVTDDVVAAPDVERPDFLPDGGFVIFVGALGEHKGVGTLASAHQQMSAALPLVVIGSGSADVGRLAGSEERPVIARSGVPHAEIMAALSFATVAAVPSRWAEPFGLVAVEAMAAGVPVVASRVGSMAEIVLDEVTGLLVKPGDAQGLSAALDRVVNDPALRSRLGRAGTDHARNFFASAVMPKVLAAYGRALASSV
ncbi:glycosyltransferase family 4 protein [Nakamurella sp. UYEF19]|uniref:glycosyltransferase family 4 protein n=1 Tax=Nakamurella sp. UYEF19 TaxID=1756392 RepID=UPI003397A220